jgi:hypothetical protein
MERLSEKQLQRSLSKVLAAKWSQELAEILLLLIIGMIALTLHARLRIPMQMPGRQGLIFMAMIVGGRMISHYRFAASLSCLGASSLLLMNFPGFSDPFLPLIYLALGVIMDGLFKLSESFGQKSLILALAGGLSWACIPILRHLISSFTGLPYHSLLNGLLLPVTTHFLFGFAGSLIAALAISKSFKN